MSAAVSSTFEWSTTKDGGDIRQNNIDHDELLATTSSISDYRQSLDRSVFIRLSDNRRQRSIDVTSTVSDGRLLRTRTMRSDCWMIDKRLISSLLSCISSTRLLLFVIILFYINSISALSTKSFTNQWAVQIDDVGGDVAADILADKYGFVNLGRVRCMFELIMTQLSIENIYLIINAKVVYFMCASCYLVNNCIKLNNINHK